MKNKTNDHIRLEDGAKYNTELTQKYRDRKIWEGGPDKSEVKSIIPGSVISIMVKEGDRVEAMQELMLYEAMKMENIIRAPFSGTVKKILVSEGEKLPKGAVMLLLK